MFLTRGTPFEALLGRTVASARFLRYGETVVWIAAPGTHEELADEMQRSGIAKPREDFDAGALAAYDGSIAVYGQSVSLVIENVPRQREKTIALLQPLSPVPIVGR